MLKKSTYRMTFIFFAFFIILMSSACMQENIKKRVVEKEEYSYEYKTRDIELMDDFYDHEFLRDMKRVSSYPEAYSSEEAIKDSLYVELMTTHNYKLLEKFMIDYEKGEDAFLRKVSYTIEGDPMFIDVFYDSHENKVNVLLDYSRDAYSGDSLKVILLTYDKITEYENHFIANDGQISGGFDLGEKEMDEK